ncbi:craniofacial development protein 2-like [Apostichopus japonicus]|uniref:craniofacial development protein 2-like n=1 Tax=Stichopus japonicus TaxID=307972 RepID=UPI003AB87D42
MIVDSPLWPRVPVATRWQQSSRGAKNPPDVWLPSPQVKEDAAAKKKENEPISVSSRTLTRTSVSNRKSTKRQFVTNKRQSVTNEPTVTKTTVEEPGKRSSSNLNIATWNVRTPRKEGNWEILLEEARSFNLDILGLSETHLTESDTMISKEDFTALLGCRKDGIGREGVGLLISQSLLSCLVSFESVSPRIITAKFRTKEGILNIIQVYAPTSTHSDAESDQFYDVLQHHLQKVNKRERLILMGDFNAKIGTDQNTWSPAMGRFGLGKINERGEKLLEFCMLNKLTVCSTHFQHKDCRKVTWTSPCGKYKNMIDFIITQQENLTTFKNCRSYCSADVGSDHNLVLATVLSAPVKVKRLKTTPKSYDVSRLHNSLIAEEFRAKIGGAFEPLLHLEDTDVETLWEKFKNTTNKVTEETVGFQRKKLVKGLPEEVRKMCHLRRKARVEMLNNPTAANKNNYKTFNKKVK